MLTVDVPLRSGPDVAALLGFPEGVRQVGMGNGRQCILIMFGWMFKASRIVPWMSHFLLPWPSSWTEFLPRHFWVWCCRYMQQLWWSNKHLYRDYWHSRRESLQEDGTRDILERRCGVFSIKTICKLQDRCGFTTDDCRFQAMDRDDDREVTWKESLGLGCKNQSSTQTWRRSWFRTF